MFKLSMNISNIATTIILHYITLHLHYITLHYYIIYILDTVYKDYYYILNTIYWLAPDQQIPQHSAKNLAPQQWHHLHGLRPRNGNTTALRGYLKRATSRSDVKNATGNHLNKTWRLRMPTATTTTTNKKRMHYRNICNPQRHEHRWDNPDADI